MHLRLAKLSALTDTPVADSAASGAFSGDTTASGGGSSGGSSGGGLTGGRLATNQWSVFCEVTACVEGPPSVGSPSGYAHDAADAGLAGLPTPPPSTAALLAPEKMRFVAIPSRAEHQAHGVSYLY